MKKLFFILATMIVCSSAFAGIIYKYEMRTLQCPKSSDYVEDNKSYEVILPSNAYCTVSTSLEVQSGEYYTDGNIKGIYNARTWLKSSGGHEILLHQNICLPYKKSVQNGSFYLYSYGKSTVHHQLYSDEQNFYFECQFWFSYNYYN